MALHTCRKGLDLPLRAEAAGEVSPGPPIRRVGLLAHDFPAARLKAEVQVGERVRRGDPVCSDRANPEVRFTAPGAGRVSAIHLGERRALRSLVIELSRGERDLTPAPEDFAPFGGFGTKPPEALDAAEIRALLVESGLWTALRRRPFGKVPSPTEEPSALFVTAMDTNPLAADPAMVLEGRRSDFDLGLSLLARLTVGPTYLCVRPGSSLGNGHRTAILVEEFAGPHPAGTAGFHIHSLAPVDRDRVAWTIGYQDVAAVGHLFRTGRLDAERAFAVGGDPAREPRLILSRLGASTADLLAGQPIDGLRVISGSILSGKAARGDVLGYMGRYEVQLTLVREDRRRVFLEWLRPGARTFSVLPVQASGVLRRPRFDLSTSTHGARRPMVPIGAYERVMPFDILPTFLLRALLVGDDETAERLGCLELVEEDLALCAFVDPGKTDFGPFLRGALERLEARG